MLFKEFVQKHRPVLDIDAVATGEHWFGYQAKQKALVDELLTSDDYLLQQMASRQVYLVKYQLKKGLAEKVGLSAASVLTQLMATGKSFGDLALTWTRLFGITAGNKIY